jgi:hypothetical protein
MIQVIALHSRYQTEAIASVDAYDTADIVLRHAQIVWQKAKDRKDRSLEELMRCKVYAEQFMTTSLCIPASQIHGFHANIPRRNFTLIGSVSSWSHPQDRVAELQIEFPELAVRHNSLLVVRLRY